MPLIVRTLIVTGILCLTAHPPVPVFADTVVVCSPRFRASLQPWVEHRQAQGHRLIFLTPDPSPESIRAAIRQIARRTRLRAVVLIGEARFPERVWGEVPDWYVPPHYVRADVVTRWGSEPEIATDAPYGDLTGDGTPELAVGRLPIRTPAQLERLVQKILDYEGCNDFGPWRRRINVVAGTGEFNPLIDSVLELVTRRFLTEGIPDTWETTMTYARWQSPFCPDPRRFRDVVLERLNEGCLFWVYIGHGHPQRLDAIRIPGADYPILEATDVADLNSRRGLSIALLLSCYSGAHDYPANCLAEKMLHAPRGPVAVIAGSRVTMPYGMAVLTTAMKQRLFDPAASPGSAADQPQLLGELLQQAKVDMLAPPEGDSLRRWMDALAAAFSPEPGDLSAELREHGALFNLFGDPLLRIARTDLLRLEAPESLEAGRTLRVQGNVGVAGRGLVQVVARRDRFKDDLPLRRHFDPRDTFLRSFDATYRRANDRVWRQQEFVACGQPFELEVALPVHTRGPCYVRVWIEGSDGAAHGATRLFVHRAEVE